LEKINRDTSTSVTNQDFEDFLTAMDNEVFDAPAALDRNSRNIRKIRMKALSKIEKQIKKETNANKDNEEEQPFMQKLKSVISNKIFVLLCGALTGLYFVVTGIQYWTPDYLENVMHQEKTTVSIYFSTVSLTAPVSGVIIGGIVTTAFGGYNTKKG